MFERAHGYQPCGAGIALQVNGLKAVEAVSEQLCKRLEATGQEFDTFDEYDQHGDAGACQGLHPSMLNVTLQFAHWLAAAGRKVSDQATVAVATLHSEENLREYGDQPCPHLYSMINMPSAGCVWGPCSISMYIKYAEGGNDMLLACRSQAWVSWLERHSAGKHDGLPLCSLAAC